MGRSRRSRKLSLIVMSLALLSIAIGLSSALALVGREARLVDVLTLFFTALGGGAALIDSVRALRASGSGTAVATEPDEQVESAPAAVD